jgi:hypothetical protein
MKTLNDIACNNNWIFVFSNPTKFKFLNWNLFWLNQIYIIKILKLSISLVHTQFFPSLTTLHLKKKEKATTSSISPTHLHECEKAHSHACFHVHVMFIKIINKPTFFKAIYLTPCRPHENSKINCDELFEIIWKHIRRSKKKGE